MASQIFIPSKPAGNPDKYTSAQVKEELLKLSDPQMGVLYFINNYCMVYTNDNNSWTPVQIWQTPVSDPYDNQLDYVLKLRDKKRVICLKARQNGASILTLATFLYRMLFQPVQNILCLSRGETEAQLLLKKMREMYRRLPKWCKVKEELLVTKSEWELSNGSAAHAYSTGKGDGMTCSSIFLDEGDLVHQSGSSLRELLLKAEPVVGINGQIVIVSKSDKTRPNSTFKNLFRAATAGTIDFCPSFMPWNVHPGRTQEWYEARKRESLAQSGTMDEIFESYPASIQESLAPRSTDKRLPWQWIAQCTKEERPLNLDQIQNLISAEQYEKHKSVFSIPKLEIYRLPVAGEEYILGVDVCEGLQSSDDASVTLLRVSNKEEVARLAVKAEPSTLGYYVHLIAPFYNNAKCLPERNQHGHAFILWMRDNSSVTLLQGIDKGVDSLSAQKRYGFATTTTSKAILFSKLADSLRDSQCIIHSQDTAMQLASIRETDLSAPKGELDDSAISYALANVAIDLLLRPFVLSFL